MSAYIENKIHNNLNECLPVFETTSRYNHLRILSSLRVFSSLRVLIKNTIKKVAFWMERSKQRRELAELDDHMLEDIGYSHTEVQKEIAKPFWR